MDKDEIEKRKKTLPYELSHLTFFRLVIIIKN